MERIRHALARRESPGDAPLARPRGRAGRALAAVMLLVALVPLFAAFEAQTVNVRAHIENAIHVDPAHIDFGVVFPQEQLSEEFGIRLSDSFLTQDRVTDVFYRLVLDRKPKVPGGAELYADLRPYAEVTKTVEPDPDELGFGDLGNLWWAEPGDPSAGSARDLVDLWRVDLAVPCIEGAVGRDYAGPVAPAEDDYGMDIRVEVLGFSYGRRVHKIAAGPRTVPTGTCVEWTFYIVVKNTSDAPMRAVELTDHFGAELDCLDYYDVDFVYGSPGWTFAQTTNKPGTQDRIRWTIDELGPLDRGLLVLHVATKCNPAGKQEYTSPGVYTLNSGATLKWLDTRGVKRSESTEPIEITAVEP